MLIRHNKRPYCLFGDRASVLTGVRNPRPVASIYDDGCCEASRAFFFPSPTLYHPTSFLRLYVIILEDFLQIQAYAGRSLLKSLLRNMLCVFGHLNATALFSMAIMFHPSSGAPPLPFNGTTRSHVMQRVCPRLHGPEPRRVITCRPAVGCA